MSDQNEAAQGDSNAPAPRAGLWGASEWFWRMLALLIAATVIWAIWLIWQLSPRSLVTELAIKNAPKPAAAAPAPAAPAVKGGTPPDLQQGQPVGLRIETELKPPAGAAVKPAR